MHIIYAYSSFNQANFAELLYIRGGGAKCNLKTVAEKLFTSQMPLLSPNPQFLSSTK